MDIKTVKVGIGVIIKKDNKILLGKRLNSHGEGTWCFPGGHLEFNETPEQCAKREVKEECGLEINHITRGPWTHDIFEIENKRYITLFMLANYISGDPQILEPTKCECWEWFKWSNFPNPLFIPIKNLLQLIKEQGEVDNIMKN